MAAEYAGGAVGYAKATATVLELNQGVDPALFTFAIPEGAEVVNLADIEPPADISAAEAETAGRVRRAAPRRNCPRRRAWKASPRCAARLCSATACLMASALPSPRARPKPAGRQGDEGAAVTVRGVDGLLFEDEGGERALLSWSEGGVSFWVGGDVSAAEALSIAESLQ